jgi:protease I
MKNNKPIGAICHGIQVITHADAALKELKFLEGKEIYPYPSLALECKLLGAIVRDEYPPDGAITQDTLVTGPSWLALSQFMRAFLGLLQIDSIPK